MLRKRLAMRGCGVAGEMNKPTGPTGFRSDKNINDHK